VGDNGLSPEHRARYPWVRYVDVPGPFNCSDAVNACVAHTRPGAGLLVMNDDTEVLLRDILRTIRPGPIAFPRCAPSWRKIAPRPG
jgi:hypothetical protein